MSNLYITHLCDAPAFSHDNPQPDLLHKLVNIRTDTRNTIHSRDEMRNILKDLEIDSFLIDYLVDHGALKCEDSLKLVLNDEALEPSSRIDILLDCLEFFDSEEIGNANHRTKLSNLVLLVNALRNSGQHEIASQLDCSRRIIHSNLPSLLADNAGYFNESYDPGSKAELNRVARRRGQLELWIQVSAIMVTRANYESLLPDRGEKELLFGNLTGKARRKKERSFDYRFTDRSATGDVGDEYNVGPLKQFFQTQHGTSFWIDLESVQRVFPSSMISSIDNGVHTITSKSPKSDVRIPTPIISRVMHFLFCCLKKSHENKSAIFNTPFSASKNPDTGSQNVIDYRLPSFVLPLSNGDAEKKPKNTQHPYNMPAIDVGKIASEKEEQLRNLKLSILDKKSSQFYSRLLDTSSVSHDKLVKFLEQNCGVLVLGFHLENCDMNESSTCLASSFLPAISIKPSAAVSISVVATTLDAVRRLLSSVVIEPVFATEMENIEENTVISPSCLSRDLEKLLFDAIISGYEDTNAMKLSVALKTEDVRLALNELST